MPECGDICGGELALIRGARRKGVKGNCMKMCVSGLEERHSLTPSLTHSLLHRFIHSLTYSSSA